MPSERRLHPASILFALGSLLRSFAVPGLLVLFTAGSRGWDWQVWVMWLAIPYFLAAVGRYFTFRYRYEPGELVIKSGLLFKNERHVPYARIQNLDAAQNPLHRLLGVVEVRVETGGGEEPEAKMSVLPLADFEEMRRRVFAGRGGEPAATAAAGASAAGAGELPAGRTLLALPPRELLLGGLIQNRGFVVVAAAFGLLWEIGLLDRFTDRMFGDDVSGRGVVRAVVRSAAGAGGLPVRQIVLTVAAFAGFLLLVRLLSMVWTLVRLYGFRLVREGDDLRSEFGLLTRVTATVPLHRIQTLTLREGPLHRLFGRAAVRIETAGGGHGHGGDDSGAKQREWLAPIIRREALPALLAEVLPEVDLTQVAWQPVHPRAFRREFKGGALVATGVSLAFVLLLGWWTPALLAVLLAWAYAGARLSVAHLGWATTPGAVAFRSGSFWRYFTVARFAKIQAVALVEGPFDRRHAMARVKVDTAGAGDFSHRVDIPYLGRETARDLHRLLAAHAARTEFRW